MIEALYFFQLTESPDRMETKKKSHGSTLLLFPVSSHPHVVTAPLCMHTLDHFKQMTVTVHQSRL